MSSVKARVKDKKNGMEYSRLELHIQGVWEGDIVEQETLVAQGLEQRPLIPDVQTAGSIPRAVRTCFLEEHKAVRWWGKGEKMGITFTKDASTLPTFQTTRAPRSCHYLCYQFTKGQHSYSSPQPHHTGGQRDAGYLPSDTQAAQLPAICCRLACA